MNCNRRPVTLMLGAVAGGLLAAALVPAAVASADQYVFEPDPSFTLVPTQVEGFPPLYNEVTGPYAFQLNDVTTHSPLIGFGGTDTHTTFGSFINDDFLQAHGYTVTLGILGPNPVVLQDAQIDIANFGGGFENEWVDLPSGTHAGISDLLITPFGDFQLAGSLFSDLTAVLSPTI